jgi:hypothetical protein
MQHIEMESTSSANPTSIEALHTANYHRAMNEHLLSYKALQRGGGGPLT